MYQTIPKRILRCSHGLWSRRAMASRLNQMFLQSRDPGIQGSRDPEIQRYRLWQLKVRHLATWFLLVKNWLGLLHCSQHLHGRRKHSTWLVPLNHQIRLSIIYKKNQLQYKQEHFLHHMKIYRSIDRCIDQKDAIKYPPYYIINYI